MKIISLLLLISVFPFQCDATSNSEIPEICKRVFEHRGGVDWALARTLAINDLVTVEKCGFAYHPSISFYSEIMDSTEYQIPVLLRELSQARDDAWRARLLYLIASVIESEQFAESVFRDRGQIESHVSSAVSTFEKDSAFYETARNLKDKIYIYYFAHDMRNNQNNGRQVEIRVELVPKDDGTGNARRKQKVYADILGRTYKTETYQWEDGAVYSTVVNDFNQRDQVLRSRQFAGDDSSTTYQDILPNLDSL